MFNITYLLGSEGGPEWRLKWRQSGGGSGGGEGGVEGECGGGRVKLVAKTPPHKQSGLGIKRVHSIDVTESSNNLQTSSLLGHSSRFPLALVYSSRFTAASFAATLSSAISANSASSPISASGSSSTVFSLSNKGLISRVKYGCSLGSGLDACTCGGKGERHQVPGLVWPGARAKGQGARGNGRTTSAHGSTNRVLATYLGKVGLVHRSIPFTKRRIDNVVAQRKRVDQRDWTSPSASTARSSFDPPATLRISAHSASTLSCTLSTCSALKYPSTKRVSTASSPTSPTHISKSSPAAPQSARAHRADRQSPTTSSPVRPPSPPPTP